MLRCRGPCCRPSCVCMRTSVCCVASCGDAWHLFAGALPRLSFPPPPPPSTPWQLGIEDQDQIDCTIGPYTRVEVSGGPSSLSRCHVCVARVWGRCRGVGLLGALTALGLLCAVRHPVSCSPRLRQRSPRPPHRQWHRSWHHLLWAPLHNLQLHRRQGGSQQGLPWHRRQLLQVTQVVSPLFHRQPRDHPLRSRHRLHLLLPVQHGLPRQRPRLPPPRRLG